jgi:hypothetical protein
MPTIFTTSQQTNFIPSVNIDRILLESSGESQTRVLLDLSMDDDLDNPELSWLMQEDYRDFLKIGLIQSTSQKQTDSIINKDPKQTLENFGNYDTYEFWIKDVVDFNKDKYLADPLLAEDGGLVYRVPFTLPEKLKIIIDLKDHLSIFAYAFIDLHALSQSKGLNFPAGTFTDKTMGEISGEMIVQSGKVVTQSYVFLTTNTTTEQIWMGPVVRAEDGKSFYAPNTNPIKILKKSTIPNYKVQDLRRRTSLEIKTPDLSKSTDALSQVDKRLKNASSRISLSSPENYYSPGVTSRSDEGVITFIFDINFENLLRDKVVFGQLMQLPAKRKILKNSRISEMKITRRRVKKQTSSSSLGTTINDISPFDKNEIQELIALNSEPKNLRFLTKKPYYGFRTSKKKKDDSIGSISEMRRGLEEASSRAIRRFVSVDNSLKDKTYGLYQYSVSMQIEDGTVIFLQDSMAKISAALKELRNYYTISTSINHYDAFTRKFKRKLSKFYTASGQTPWLKAIQAYIEVMSDFIKLRAPQRKEIVKELTAISNPLLGTPEGISSLIGLLQNFETLIYEMLIGKVKISDQQPDGSLSRIYNNSNYEKFMVICNHFFNSSVDSDISPSDGHKVLPTNTPILYLKDFEERAKDEASKYFVKDNIKGIEKEMGTVPGLNDENQGISNISDSFYTFFTPQSITAGGNKMELQNRGNEVWQNEKYEQFTSYLLSAPPGPKKSFRPLSHSGADDSASLSILGGVLGSNSVTVRTTMLENKNTKPTKPTHAPDKSMDTHYNSQKSEKENLGPLLQEGVRAVGSIFTSVGSMGPSPLSKMSNFNLTSNSNFVDTKIRKSKLKEGQLTGLPNQISSLFLSKSPAVINDWQDYEKDGIDFPSSDKTNLMFLYNYSTLFKIEYQDGYVNNADGDTLIKQPIWKSFSENTLSRVKAGDSLLCRIEKYENDEIGVFHHDILDLPIIDKFFFFVKNKTTLKKLEKPSSPAFEESAEDVGNITSAAAPFSRSLIVRKK